MQTSTLTKRMLGGLAMVSTALLGACNGRPEGWAPTISSDVQGTEAYQHLLFAGPCVFPVAELQGLFATTAGILGAELIGAGVTALGDLLIEAGKEKSWKVVRHRPVMFGEASTMEPQCVQLVRGKFRSAPAEGSVSWRMPNVNDNDMRRMAAAGIWLADRPDFFLEFQLIGGVGGVAFQQTYMDYARPLRPAGLGTDSSAVLAIEFALPAPGEAVGGTGAPVAQLVLGDIRPPFSFRYKSPSTYVPAAARADGVGQPLPPRINPPAPAAGETPREELLERVRRREMVASAIGTGGSGNVGDKRDAGPREAVGGGRSFANMVPVQTGWLPIAPESGETGLLRRTLQVTVVETDPANPMLTLIGTAIKNSSTEVRTAARSELLPSERERLRNEAQTERLTRITNLNSARFTAEQSIAACNAALAASAANVGELCAKAEGDIRIVRERANILGEPTPQLSPLKRPS